MGGSGQPTLEVCVDDLAGAVVAARCGADRLELCSALELGGLTPTTGLLQAVTAEVAIPVIALLRPRGGGFCYTADELRVLHLDCARVLECGVRGIAFGVLTPEGDIDVDRCEALIEPARGLELVFHRAFDRVRDPRRALEQLIELGVQRVLTSGQQRSAWAGREVLAALVAQARGRIEILPAGGIAAANVAALLAATGCRQVHGSFSAPDPAGDPTGGSDVCLGPLDPTRQRRTDPSAVRAVRAVLDALA